MRTIAAFTMGAVFGTMLGVVVMCVLCADREQQREAEAKRTGNILAELVDPDTLEYRGLRFYRPKYTSPDVVSDGITGYCRCHECGKPIDPWDHYCKHCGREVIGRATV